MVSLIHHLIAGFFSECNSHRSAAVGVLARCGLITGPYRDTAGVSTDTER